MQTVTLATVPQRPEPTRARWTARIPALSTLLLLVLLGGAAALPLWPPAARPVSAPATEFSADRAFALLDGIAAVPHPSGSPAAAQVRGYLLDRLRQLGLEPQVTTQVAARTGTGVAAAGTVTNVHARLAGQEPTGRVLLVAHYDSVPTGPGAADNGANVAAILEVARALRAGPQPRNDIDLLLTDGEEQGLLGATAFVGSGRAGDPRRVVVVVNLEARGVSGPAVMFQLAGTGLTPAVRAADPVTTSLAAEVYRMLPNDTDLTVFEAAGMRGLNFAFMGGVAHYHTTHDDISRVSRRSIQDMGDAALAAARHLAGADLAAGGSEATYFSLFGTVLSYPGWLVLPLAGIAVAGYLVLLWAGRRRGLSLGRVGWAAGTLPLCLLGAVVIGLAGWRLLTLARPEFGLLAGNVYHPGRYALGGAALLLVGLVGWYRLARRKASPLEVTAGALGWFSLLALGCAVLLPAGAYLFTWPALIGMAAVAATWRFPDAGSRWHPVAYGAAAVPAVALLLPVGMLLVPVLGLSLLAAPLLLAALLGVTMLGVLEPLPRRRVLTAGMVAVAAAGVGAIGIGAAVDGYDAAEPRPVSLGYLLEADTGTATWISSGGAGQPVVGALLTAGPVRLDDRVPALGGWSMRSGPAPVATTLAGPRVEQSPAEEQDGVRTVRVRILAPAGAHRVDVYADTTGHEILDATVDGAPLAGGQNLPGAVEGDWRWGFGYAAPPVDGVDLQLRARGPGTVRIRVVTSSAGLPSGVDAPALPPELSWTPWPSVAGQTFVVRTFRI